MQAIELSADILANVKFIQEKKLIGKCVEKSSHLQSSAGEFFACCVDCSPQLRCPVSNACCCCHPLLRAPRKNHRYFDEISQDTGKYCFGVDDTLSCLEMGAVETLIVWENLEVTRHTLMNPTTGDTVIKHLTPEQEKDTTNFTVKETGENLESQDKISLLEWLANEYKRFGCTLEFITNRSQEGSQFCRGFGGIGGILRYQVDLENFQEGEDVDGNFYNSEEYAQKQLLHALLVCFACLRFTLCDSLSLRGSVRRLTCLDFCGRLFVFRSEF